jgi:8-oxo-dGTP pyrophosphatase MutT (NUDIX family)
MALLEAGSVDWRPSRVLLRPDHRLPAHLIRPVEVKEETGVEVVIVAEERFRHPAVGVVASPFAILVMPVSDSKVGPHHHIDMVYVCRASSVEVTRQTGEVSGCVWVPVADVAALVTPPELPSLIAEAAAYFQLRS